MWFDPPTSDPARIHADREIWERGEETPGRVLAKMNTHGLADLLEQLDVADRTPAG